MKTPPAEREFAELLNRKFEEMKRRNPAFSVRALSRRLAMNSGGVSAILAGRRAVSLKLASRIAERLNFTPEELRTVAASYGGAAPKYDELSIDQYRAISEWHHLAILSLVKVRGFSAEPAAIGSRLGIPTRKAEQAVSRLLRLGLLARDPERGLVRTRARLRTQDGLSNSSLRNAHHATLELAQVALEERSVDERDFTALTVALSPEILPKAKERSRQFMQEMDALLESLPPKEVYKLCVQLFPLTKKEKEI